MDFADIEKKTGLKYLGSFRFDNRWRRQPYDSDKIVYVISRLNGYVLKVGHTTNWRNRFSPYRSQAGDQIKVDMYEAKSWSHQDEAEMSLRRYMFRQGHSLPWDFTNGKKPKNKETSNA